MTPFGSPVLPLEKMMVAMSSSRGFCLPPRDFSISRIGKNQDTQAAVTRSRDRGLSARSSNINACAGGWMWTRSRKAPNRAQTSREEDRASECTPKAQLWCTPIGHRKAKWMSTSRLYERAVQRPHVVFAELVGFSAKFLHRLAHVLSATGGRHWLAESHSNRVWDFAW